MSQDSSDPIDALKRLIEATAEQRFPLDPEDLHAVSGLRPGLEQKIDECITSLDAAGRFVLLGALQETMGESGVLEFTALFAAGMRDDDMPVRTLAANGLSVCETAEATAALLAAAASGDEDDTVRVEAITALGAVALRVELGLGRRRSGRVGRRFVAKPSPRMRARRRSCAPPRSPRPPSRTRTGSPR